MTAAELRPLLFSLAYRMVGSVSEAEDLVQEALLRFHAARSAGEEIRSPRAYLSAVTTRLAIDHLRSARVRRERYVGTWLPEPLLAGTSEDAAVRTEAAEDVSHAVLVLLESLDPVERAVLVLHDAFDYSFEEIAEIVDRTPANCRQIAVRARRRVDEGRARFEVARERREQLTESLLAAIEEGEVEALAATLAEDVVFYGDGGGKAPAVARPLQGRDRVARLLANLAKAARRGGIGLERTLVNGEPGAAFRAADGALVNVVSVEVGEDGVRAVRSVVSPDKLAHLGPLADVEALLRGAS